MLNDTSCCLAVSYLHWGLLSSEDRQMGDKSRHSRYCSWWEYYQ